MTRQTARHWAAAAAIALLAMPGTGLSDHHEGDRALNEIDAFIEKQSIDKGKAGWKESLSRPPKTEKWDKDKKYRPKNLVQYARMLVLSVRVFKLPTEARR